MPDDLTKPTDQPVIQVPVVPPVSGPGGEPPPPPPPELPAKEPTEQPKTPAETTPPSPPPTEEPPLVISTPPKKSRVKVIMASIVLLVLLVSVPGAVYLVQRRVFAPKAAPGVPGDMTCLSDIAIGPGPYSFAANGVGHENRTSASFTINLPAGATPLANYVYAFLSGEKEGSPTNPNGITINGTPLSGEKVYERYHSDWQWTGYVYRVQVPPTMIDTSASSFTFNVSIVPPFPMGVNKSHGADTGGAHGVGIVIPYEKSDLPTSKIIIRSCGDFVYHGAADDYSDPINFSFPDIAAAGATLKAAFFFGEGEGDGYGGTPRPNYLWYNDSTRLDPTDGTNYPADSSDDGYWWDSRVTGEDLPNITASGTTVSFKAHSPKDGHGDSFYFVGGILQYPVAAPTPTPTPTGTPTPTQVLSCTDLTSTPNPSGLSKGDKITLTCTGTSSPNPINHFEFRVGIDGGTPASLPNASATKTDSKYKGEIKYTIPNYGCYKVECRACVSTDSSNCTVWGQAGKTLLTE